jgi:2-polyprenyl-3-methyl-5-hydroxy-6-metoxy-1,4-benzoquinol methylase
MRHVRPRIKTVIARAYDLTTTPPGPEDLVEVEPGVHIPRYQTMPSVDPTESSRRFFARLPESFDLRGKRVLDVGCGSGDLCIAMAQLGARAVVGVEVTEPRYAWATLHNTDPDLPVEFFGSGGDLKSLDLEPFDVVVSKDSFEHYGAQPGSPAAAEMVRDMAHLLVPGGLLVIGFGPTWKAPFGGHINTKMPYAQLLFPEEVIFDEFRRSRPPGKTARTFEEGVGINRMTLARFRQIMAASGLECVWMGTNRGDHPAYKVMRTLAHVPGLTEYMTQNIYGIWRVPLDRESPTVASSAAVA